MTNSEQLQANNERINAATELLKTKAAGSSVEIYDGLDSDSTTAALSANQGKILNEKIPTDYGADLDLIIDSLTYVITAQLKDKNGAPIGTAKTIDLPLESVVVSGAYDKTTKEVILTLKDNSKINFSVADLVDGLASTSDLTNYLQKVNSYSDYPVVYAAWSGTQTTIEVSGRTLPEGSIPMRDATGQVTVSTPTRDSAAANKKYVDDLVATKANTTDLANYFPMTGGNLNGNLAAAGYVQGHTLVSNGDVQAQYVQAAAAGHETSTYDKIATLSGTGYIRYRTKAELKSDLSVPTFTFDEATRTLTITTG